MNDLKKRLGALALAVWMTLSLAACSVPLGDAEVRTGGEDGTVVIDGEAIWDETAPAPDAAPRTGMPLRIQSRCMSITAPGKSC